MSTAPRNPMSDPGRRSLIEELLTGTVPFDLVTSLPAPGAQDTRRADLAAREMAAALRETKTAQIVEDTGDLPDGLVDHLRGRRLLHLAADPGVGGRGLTAWGVLRVIEAAAGACTGAGLLLAYHNGLGAVPYLPVLAPGPTLDFLRGRLAAGALTGAADTEPGGAANWARAADARPAEDGSGYLLNARKVFIGNGPLADLLAVTAAVEQGGVRRTRIFFVDTSSPGFAVGDRQRFMGLAGSPNATLTLTDVHVPRERVLAEEDPAAWNAGRQVFPLALGRLFVVAAPGLAIGRACLRHARQFVPRRTVDGRPLAGYDEIQRVVAADLADVYAMEAVAEWAARAEDAPLGANAVLEQFAAKNITSLLAWNCAERTTTLLAGEGYETARSKAARGADPAPMEQLLRDARGLRIAGGVESLLSSRLGNFSFTYFYPRPVPEAPPAAPADDSRLSPRNRGHLAAAGEEARRLHRTCRRLAADHPRYPDLVARDRIQVIIGAAVEELTAMVLTLGRAARDAGAGLDRQDLADVHCTAATQRLADGWARLERIVGGGEPDHRAVSDALLAGDRYDDLAADRAAGQEDDGDR
ncbi:acyl-CoA dehydrogenase family protein [Streptomyces sp. IBSBF 2435]|uniref:acyl-CoA dehydrogenase family protein n=1 Tax=Streptomyces sp. IBSBF 2435 TaxID=2903531 RepID=UPI002FDC3153